MHNNIFEEEADRTYEWIRESVQTLGVVVCLGILALCFYPFI